MKRAARIGLGIAAAWVGSVAAAPPASAELRTFILAWTAPGGGFARGTLTIDDAVCNNPGMSNFAGPEGCFVDLAFTVGGDVKGKGTYTLDDMNDVLLDLGAVAIDFGAEVIAQGPNDINFFGNASAPGGVDPFVMAASGAPPEDALTLVSMTPLAFPFSPDAAKCSGAVAKAGAAYFSARHKALHACRAGLAKGTALFTDKAKTDPVVLGSECALEFKAASKIAKARAKLGGSLAKKCSDAVLATIPACAATVGALANPGAGTGCLLETVDFNVDEMLQAEFGF